MAQVDPNRIINKLALQLAQQSIDLAIKDILLEDAQAKPATSAPADIPTQHEE